MRTGIEQHPHLPITATGQDHRPAGDISGAKITRLGNLRFVTGINPTAIEDPLLFRFQNRRIGEHTPIDAK